MDRPAGTEHNLWHQLWPGCLGMPTEAVFLPGLPEMTVVAITQSVLSVYSPDSCCLLFTYHHITSPHTSLWVVWGLQFTRTCFQTVGRSRVHRVFKNPRALTGLNIESLFPPGLLTCRTIPNDSTQPRLPLLITIEIAARGVNTGTSCRNRLYSIKKIWQRLYNRTLGELSKVEFGSTSLAV